MGNTSKGNVKEINRKLTGIIVLISLVSLMFLTNLTLVIKDSPQAMELQWTAKEFPIRADKASVIQVIIMDDTNNWVEGANVKGEIQYGSLSETLDFVHIEDGLYETVVSFPQPGLWEGNITAKKGLMKEISKVVIRVNG